MNRNLIYITTFGILLIIACGILMSPARAYDRVPQGGTVFLGERYDISGVMAGYGQLVYISEYSDDFSPDNSTVTYSITMPQQKELYYNFSIDPDIFGTRLGWWYHYNGIFNANANDRAFKVLAVRPPVNETVNNGTFKNMTQMWVPKPLVPERHVADYLIARGDPLNLTFTVNKSSCWIFGRLDGIYNRPVKDQYVYFNASEMENFEPGTYTIMFHSVGNDLNFDLRVVDNKLQYFDSTNFHVYTLDLVGMTPQVVMDKILSVSGANDDTFTLKTLEIQNPMIDIVSADVAEVSDLTGVLQVRGYTNAENNSPLSFIIDKEKTRGWYNTFYSTVKEYDNPGSMRYFDYGIPIVWSQLAPGLHDINVQGSHNTSMTVPFYVYEAPAEPFKPNQTMKYVSGNLFVPTPTPEIVIQEKVVHEVVTLVVDVPVTPSDEQVHVQQSKVTWEAIITIAEWAFLAILMGGLVLYLIRYYYRRKDG